MSIGSLIALIVFVLASLGFGFYVANFGNYNKTYGAIGGVIVMLLWLWILNMSLLFGAEFDAEMERGRQLQAGHRGRGNHPAAAPGHQEERQAPGAGGGRHPARAANCARSTSEQGNGQDGGGMHGTDNQTAAVTAAVKPPPAGARATASRGDSQ